MNCALWHRKYGFINWVNVNWHRKKIRKLTFRALAFRRSEWRNCGLWQTERIEESSTSIRSDEGLTLAASACESFYGGQFTLSTQLIKHVFFNTSHRCSTTVSLETYPFCSIERPNTIKISDINKTETETNNAQCGSSVLNFYNITQGLINTIRQSLITGRFGEVTW